MQHGSFDKKTALRPVTVCIRCSNVRNRKKKNLSPWLNSDKELITYQLLADGFRGAYGQIPSDF